MLASVAQRIAVPAVSLQTMSAVRFYDEMHAGGGEILPHFRHYSQWLASQPANRILQKRHEAEIIKRLCRLRRIAGSRRDRLASVCLQAKVSKLSSSRRR